MSAVRCTNAYTSETLTLEVDCALNGDLRTTLRVEDMTVPMASETPASTDGIQQCFVCLMRVAENRSTYFGKMLVRDLPGIKDIN
jgi:hypothetical protein